MSVVIPYVSTPRPDTGVTNAKLGIWLFLLSEVMLFGGLFSAYILLRVGADVWPEGVEVLNVPIATVNTLVLIISSVTVVLGWAALVEKNFKLYRIYMIVTLLCGVAFMINKSIEYASKFSHGISPATDNFYGIYFTITGLHGLHVLGGMLALAWLAWPGSKMWETDPERFTGRVECAGLFWHLVDLVWIVVFPVLYLI
ncbi:MAG: heme-copper oxidase subunit III [Oligoflexales bacterium]